MTFLSLFSVTPTEIAWSGVGDLDVGPQIHFSVEICVKGPSLNELTAAQRLGEREQASLCTEQLEMLFQ